MHATGDREKRSDTMRRAKPRLITQPHQSYGFAGEIVLTSKDMKDLKERKFRFYKEKLGLEKEEAKEWWKVTLAAFRDMGMVR